ncbi:EF-P beta-lysylation protein EpmB [Candidatus Curculioniphilus buchneri]|uniref:EF-P beta-lysylation protein EpmB n=1 Tax=Candidatus Curculioniphilus buchneri TaxID=690594 RepID=UPI00376EB18E
MTSFTIKSIYSKKDEWLLQLSDVISDPIVLLKQLRLDHHSELCKGAQARRLFAFRVPRAFVARMRPGDPDDPLLRQVITTNEEFLQVPNFTIDPLNEQHNVAVLGLLHKYKNRVLLIVKGSCAIHCRYCFRRHFPYQNNQGSKSNWLRAIDYIQQHTELNEVILSGGDPLMAKDHELDELISFLETIPHLTTLRIHTRLPVVIPARITEYLCQRLERCHLKVVLVTHINHAREIDTALSNSMTHLRNAKVTLLNQTVLLRGINDNAQTLANLSETLFSVGILPYYLHLLDRVQGAAHFMVEDKKALIIMQQLWEKVSGYLVPLLTRETSGNSSKTSVESEIKQR